MWKYFFSSTCALQYIAGHVALGTELTESEFGIMQNTTGGH